MVIYTGKLILGLYSLFEKGKSFKFYVGNLDADARYGIIKLLLKITGERRIAPVSLHIGLDDIATRSVEMGIVGGEFIYRDHMDIKFNLCSNLVGEGIFNENFVIYHIDIPKKELTYLSDFYTVYKRAKPLSISLEENDFD